MPDLWAEGIYFSISIYSFLKAKHCRRIITYNIPKDIEDQSFALSFYRSQNVLCQSKFSKPAQKFDFI